MNTWHLSSEHKFAFGLSTAGFTGGDPVSGVNGAPIEAWESVYRLADIGGWGVSFHDDDLVPPGASSTERDDILDKFRKALDSTGVVVSMVTTNLFWHPVFKAGAFTSADRDVRRYALKKTMGAIDLGVELGAELHEFGGGGEDVEAVAAKPPLDSLARYREALDFLCGYVLDRGYSTRFAIEPKRNEPRGDALLPTVGHTLAFIDTLDHPGMVGVNPQVGHETAAGLSVYHGMAQAIDAGKLFHIGLNRRSFGRDDQDRRFGSEGITNAFFVVKLLEDSGYRGPLHLDTRPYRVQDAQHVRDFALGCMHTYMTLAAKARRFADDPEIREALEECGALELAEATVGTYTLRR
jgi:xylose isomerase